MMTFIVFSLFNFIIVYGSLFYILSLKITVKRFLLSLISNTIISFFAIYYQDSIWISMSLSILLAGVLFYLFSKDHLVFHHLFVIHIGSILTEYTALLVLDFFHSSLYRATLLLVVQYILIIFIQFTLFIVIYKRIITRYQKDVQLSSVSKIVLLFIVGITFFVFYALVFIPSEIGDVDLSGLNLLLLLFYFLVMVGLTGIVLRTILKENQIHRKMMEHQQFTHYMHALEQVNRDMQSFRHDYANILISLRGYIENEDLKGLQTYFNEHIVKVEERTLHKNQMFNQLDRLKLIELKGLLATKLLSADEASVPVNIEIPDTIDTIAIDIIDLTRVIGIFLDNAIEVSAMMNDPQINIAFISRNTEIIIVFENRIMEDNLVISRLFQEHYSTKGNERGLGLSNVKAILSNYPNVSLNTYIENHWFVHEVIIEEVR